MAFCYPPSLVLGMCLMYADRLDEGREFLEPARPAHGRTREGVVRGAALVHLAECEFRAGRYERAAECAAGLQIAERSHERAASSTSPP